MPPKTQPPSKPQEEKPKKKGKATAEIERLQRDFPQLVKLCIFERSSKPDTYFMNSTGVVFRLPMPPNMGNWRGHYMVKNAIRQEYIGCCKTLLSMRLLPKAPKVPLVYANLGIVMHVKAINDHDNALSRCKFAIDWLQREGYIQSDKPKFLTPEIPKQIVSNALPMLIFTLKDYQHGAG